ncbi:MAG: hypothetical protein IME98_05405, partial [Proteobacteria bacterium]|nr:hypothetical protein [Pseudomonadota bacterium]
MNSKFHFKTTFLSFFKPLSITLLIIMVVECLQLLQAMSYFHYIVKEVEVLRLCAAFFLLGLIITALLCVALAGITRLKL